MLVVVVVIFGRASQLEVRRQRMVKSLRLSNLNLLRQVHLRCWFTIVGRVTDRRHLWRLAIEPITERDVALLVRALSILSTVCVITKLVHMTCLLFEAHQ